MSTLVYVDVEAAVRTWARTHPAITAQVGARTFFALPDDYQPAVKGPALTVALVDDDPHHASGLDRASLQFDCWGATKAEAAAVRLAAVTALHSLVQATVGDTVLCDAQVVGSLFSPDPTTDPATPRYVLTCERIARPTALA